ncbi:hypothetical protein [Persephonella sp.]
MEFISWTPVIFSRSGFPRDEEGRPFLPKNAFVESLTSAVIFYYIKKDREIENRVRKYLLSENLDIKEVAKQVKKIITDKYPVLDELDIPERVYLPPSQIKEKYVEIFDLKEWIDVRGFKTEVFSGVLQLEISSPHIEKFRAASHSYAEALARMEHSLLKDHPLASIFYEPLINQMKKWDIPLRIGMWTEVSFKGDLLFFWRIKEVREKLMKTLKTDIRPRYVLYLPDEKQTTGWAEIKTK